jgi:hypothetical protein
MAQSTPRSSTKVGLGSLYCGILPTVSTKHVFIFT